MTKSSAEYTELAGLRITLSSIPYQKSTTPDADMKVIKSWIESRIKELEAK